MEYLRGFILSHDLLLWGLKPATRVVKQEGGRCDRVDEPDIGTGIPEGIPTAPTIMGEACKKIPLSERAFFSLCSRVVKPVRQIWLARVKIRLVFSGCQFGTG